MKHSIINICIILFLLTSCSHYDDLHKGLNSLKDYPDYDLLEDNNIQFTYMDSSDINLRTLKQKFELEKIAGNGDELSQIKNLMLWVNENIKHDGSSTNPFPPNSNHIIETCKNENRGVNCRMLATVLNEFYLAMGFKSRFITCKPMEHDFDDCHVVNVVYSKQLNKWIMMDPSFAGFFMDENDNLLGLSEVRIKLMNKEKIGVSKLLNHNKNKYSKTTYKNYMTKNTFRFSCPINSAYNYEALEYKDRAYAELIPLDYIEETTNYSYTRNPDLFWAEP